MIITLFTYYAGYHPLFMYSFYVPALKNRRIPPHTQGYIGGLHGGTPLYPPIQPIGCEIITAIHLKCWIHLMLVLQKLSQISLIFLYTRNYFLCVWCVLHTIPHLGGVVRWWFYSSTIIKRLEIIHLQVYFLGVAVLK